MPVTNTTVTVYELVTRKKALRITYQYINKKHQRQQLQGKYRVDNKKVNYWHFQHHRDYLD